MALSVELPQGQMNCWPEERREAVVSGDLVDDGVDARSINKFTVVRHPGLAERKGPLGEADHPAGRSVDERLGQRTYSRTDRAGFGARVVISSWRPQGIYKAAGQVPGGPSKTYWGVGSRITGDVFGSVRLQKAWSGNGSGVYVGRLP